MDIMLKVEGVLHLLVGRILTEHSMVRSAGYNLDGMWISFDDERFCCICDMPVFDFCFGSGRWRLGSVGMGVEIAMLGWQETFNPCVWASGWMRCGEQHLTSRCSLVVVRDGINKMCSLTKPHV